MSISSGGQFLICELGVIICPSERASRLDEIRPSSWSTSVHGEQWVLREGRPAEGKVLWKSFHRLPSFAPPTGHLQGWVSLSVPPGHMPTAPAKENFAELLGVSFPSCDELSYVLEKDMLKSLPSVSLSCDLIWK